MNITDSIINYRRSLKRRNYSKYTVRNYMNTLKQFVIWLDEPIEAVTHKKLVGFIDDLLARRLKPKTINCYLHSIRRFYDYLINEKKVVVGSTHRFFCLFDWSYVSISSVSPSTARCGPNQIW